MFWKINTVFEGGPDFYFPLVIRQLLYVSALAPVARKRGKGLAGLSWSGIKAGFHLKAVFTSLNVAFVPIISLTFQATSNPSA